MCADSTHGERKVKGNQREVSVGCEIGRLEWAAR
jgi:hypothetical protein